MAAEAGAREPDDAGWRGLCRVGGITVLVAVLIAPAEIAIGMLPGASRAAANTVTVIDWFRLFQDNWFLAMRGLGLLNLCGAVLLTPTVVAIFYALRRDSEALAALGAVLFFVGIAVYLAGNRAFPMLLLSREYAHAATDAQRPLLAAAGQVMLAEGQSRAGILLVEFACFFLSALMAGSGAFGRWTGGAGLAGNGLMMVVEIAFMPPRGVGMGVAACGGLALMAWYAMVGLKLLRWSGAKVPPRDC